MFLSLFNVYVDNFIDLFWYLINGPKPSVSTARPHQGHAAPQKPPTSNNPRPASTRPKPQPSAVIQTPSATIAAGIHVAGATVVPDRENKAFFALIIGVDKYIDPHYPVLSGAVKDAKAIRDYLLSTLHVPDNQIVFLLDKQATRADIIKGFLDLQTDSRIKKGDPILIFFAGHGCKAKAPPGWASGDVGNEIQMIMPQDSRKSATSGHHGIPDRTISALLNGIASKKGDNITIIFDCCHSASGTRKDADPSRRVRGIPIVHTLPSDLDQNLLGGTSSGRGISIAPGFLQKGLRSHVLLAACGEKEEAKENNGRGAFTQALLDALVESGPEKLTYSSVLERMRKLPSQNPQCEGVNQHRRLFDARAPSPRRACFTVQMKDGRYVMSAGAVHGITEGAEFTVYKDRESILDGRPLGVLTISRSADISAFSTFLVPTKVSQSITLTPTSVALQTKAGDAEDLLVRMPLDTKLLPVFNELAKEMQKAGPGSRKIRPVSGDAKASLGLSVYKDSVGFDILDPRVIAHGLHRLRDTVALDVDHIYPVIRAAAHFHWYLSREKKDLLIQSQIDIEFTKLEHTEGEYDFSGNPIFNPVGENLLQSGAVNVVASSDDALCYYGLTVKNRSVRDLYLNAFYFDNSDLSIDPVYQTPTSGVFKTDPTLPCNGGSIPLGYGSGGEVPHTYNINNDGVVDVGFLMLFITSENIDLSMIPQKSPFSPEGRGFKRDPPKQQPIWGTVLIPVIIRPAVPN